MNYAPIVIFTYNRLSELKATIEALQKNTLALQSTLTIYSDAPNKENHVVKVQKVRDFLKTIDGFGVENPRRRSKCNHKQPRITYRICHAPRY